MDILSKTDDEIFELAKPIWDNLVKSSNLKDYGGFTKDFSTQMLFGANEVELGKQWANNKLITNLKETFDPFGCLRRGDHITVLIKQTNKEIPGEFLGRLVLGVEDDTIKVFGANEVELGKQWANNKLITNLKETFEPFGCLRRGDHITVLIKQTNKEIPGEFLGRLVLGVEDNMVKVFGATIY